MLVHAKTNNKYSGAHVRQAHGAEDFAQARKEPVLAMSLRMRHRKGDLRGRSETRQDDVVRMLRCREDHPRAYKAWVVPYTPLQAVGRHTPTLLQPERSEVFRLRRPRHSDMPRMAHLRKLPSRYGSRLPRRSDDRAGRQQRPLLPRKLLLGDARRADEKSASRQRMERGQGRLSQGDTQ